MPNHGNTGADWRICTSGTRFRARRISSALVSSAHPNLHETVVFVRATVSLHAISRPHQRQEASLLKKDSDL